MATDNPYDLDGADLEVLAETPRYRQWIFEFFEPHLRGRVAEIGAGLGSFSELLRPKADALHLVEPSPKLYERLAIRFQGRDGVQTYGDTAETHLAACGAAAYDAIVMVNVLEHIEDDRAALGQLKTALAPGGTLLLFVPALQMLYSKIDRKVGHYRRYGRGDLTAKVKETGFSVSLVRYADFLGIAPWFVLNTLAGSTGFNPAMVKLYDSIGVPVTKGMESMIPPPLGKNLVLIAHKEG